MRGRKGGRECFENKVSLTSDQIKPSHRSNSIEPNVLCLGHIRKCVFSLFKKRKKMKASPVGSLGRTGRRVRVWTLWGRPRASPSFVQCLPEGKTTLTSSQPSPRAGPFRTAQNTDSRPRHTQRQSDGCWEVKTWVAVVVAAAAVWGELCTAGVVPGWGPRLARWPQ